MALTAEDIQTVSFSIERKGYDVDEVDVFLERVADEVDAMHQTILDLQEQLADALENGTVATVTETVEVESYSDDEVAARLASVSDLEMEIEDLQAQLAEKNANDSAISQALIVAQRSADDIVNNARAEASSIVKDADEEADRIISKAESDRMKIAESIRALESDRSDVRAQYREMLANFMADAQRKLAEIDGDARRASLNAQARADAQEAFDVSENTMGVIGGAHSANAVPVSGNYIEKDFSGYGDADDDFIFDID